MLKDLRTRCFGSHAAKNWRHDLANAGTRQNYPRVCSVGRWNDALAERLIGITELNDLRQ